MRYFSDYISWTRKTIITKLHGVLLNDAFIVGHEIITYVNIIYALEVLNNYVVACNIKFKALSFTREMVNINGTSNICLHYSTRFTI